MGKNGLMGHLKIFFDYLRYLGFGRRAHVSDCSFMDNFVYTGTYTGGGGAIFATWIPKLCSLPPGINLRKNITLFPTSLTDTL